MTQSQDEPADWERELPQGPSPLTSTPMMRWVCRYGEAVRLSPFDNEQLEVHVGNKIKLLDGLIERSRTFFGRLLNRISGAELERIALDGIAVQHLFDLIGDPPPGPLDIKAVYRIPHQEVREWYARAFPPVRSPGLDIRWHRRT